MTTAAESTPVTAEYLIEHGASPAEAQVLAAQANALSGRHGAEAKAEMNFAVRDTQPAPKAPPPASGVTQAQAVDALNAHNEAQLRTELDAVMAPPANAYDYQIPQAHGEVSQEAMAADRALVNLLHAEAVPLHIGNALMRDLQTGAGRYQQPKSADDIRALTPFVNQILARAQTSPELRALVGSATPAQLLSVLSRETVVSLKGFVDYRARARR